MQLHHTVQPSIAVDFCMQLHMLDVGRSKNKNKKSAIVQHTAIALEYCSAVLQQCSAATVQWEQIASISKY